MNKIVGHADIAFLVFDTLRYDVATEEFEAGRTPNLAKIFPAGWEKRHSPGSFTYAAHHAFFAGFLPTPAQPAKSQERLFASQFTGSETAGSNTKSFPEPDIISGLRNEGYHSICVGGVGFFNKQTALSCVLPNFFDESHWSQATGVTDPESTGNQISVTRKCFASVAEEKRIFFYLNISAIHQPNCCYIEGKTNDDLKSHAAALRYVDSCIPALFDIFQSRSDTFVIACSDHGTLYGEEGFTGHRIGHEAVYTVPYMETLLPKYT
ncbi:MAG: STM4013/SEN3800 family hydrolase [Verrucomicrobiales bacterium]|nr:STM4013/SEN3800 family hydrolase [Verrucomicrobiales bacterium]